MLLRESRRLTGRNLLTDRPGAVLDVGPAAAPGAPPGLERLQPLVAAWRRQVRRMLDAVGWPAEEIHVRHYASGASLALTAPADALYAATELNEWAWQAALAEVAAGGHRGGDPGCGGDATPGAMADFAAAAARLRAAIAAEGEPALIALGAAARAHGVALLFDDDHASVGLGTGSRTWERGALPSPAEVDWPAVHDVPVVLVTGTNGKTTTVRLVAAMLAAAGRVAGVTSTDRIAVGGTVLDSGDYSGPGGARTLLRDRRVEAAVLETARGGLLRRGLAVERAMAAAVTNIAADHLGDYGVESLDDLAAAKLVVAGAVQPAGRVVLNADDLLLARRGGGWPAPVTWFSLAPGEAIAAHLAAGGDAAFLAGDHLVLARGPHRRETVAHLSGVPIAFGGAARYNVANALAAIALAAALDLPIAAMAAGLAAVRNDADDGRAGAEAGGAGQAEDAGEAGEAGEAENEARPAAAGNPGRAMLIEMDGFRVLVDYAHNPHGLAALLAFTAQLPARRRLLLLGQAGDRDDEAIRALARTAWSAPGGPPDRVVIKELPAMLRGRAVGEVTALLEDELRRLGAHGEDLERAADEIAGVRQALAWALPGDLLVLLVHNEPAAAMALLRQRQNGA